MISGIRQKILVATAITAIAASGIASLFGYLQARSALRDASFARLTSVREMKADQIEGYFDTIRDQILSLSRDPETISAARSFRNAFAANDLRGSLSELEQQRLLSYYDEEFIERLRQRQSDPPPVSRFVPRDPTARRLQLQYVVDNAFETGSKHLLDRSDVESTYALVHSEHHPFFRDFLERFGYYDVFLIDPGTGHIIYSVYKEIDFGTSLVSGPYAGTNFADVFDRAVTASPLHEAHLADFEPYAPSYFSFASFIAAPIIDGGELLGVLAFQMPVDRINETMTSGERWVDVGLGASGETYIVADDFTIRNEPRFLIEDRENYLQMIEDLGVPTATLRQIQTQNSAIGLQTVRTYGSEQALTGNTGIEVILDYRGVDVLSAYRPIDVEDVNWVILSEIDAAEAFADVYTLRWRLLLGLLILIPVVALVAIRVSRSITGPVAKLAGEADELASGNLEAPIDVSGSDEIGDLARRFEAMRGSIRDLVARQERAIDALATPIIPFGDKTIVLPLVGDMDERRMVRLRSELSNAIHEKNASSVVIDMTGVPDIPADVATGLQRVTHAAHLLGARVMITGMQAAAARTMAQLDIALESVLTERTLETGLLRLAQYSATEAEG